jgi:hypothetical protein
LAIDAQNLRHLLFELRVAPFQVIAHLVRLNLLLIEDVAQRALSQLGKAPEPVPGNAGRLQRHPALCRIAGAGSDRRRSGTDAGVGEQVAECTAEKAKT